MLAADSDEGVGGNSVFHGQEGSGEYFWLARDEVDVRVINLALAIEDFVGEYFYVSSQFTGFSEVS